MKTAPQRILLVDDEQPIRFALRDFLEAHGYQIDEAESCAHARDRFRRVRPDAVILDYRLNDGTAIDLLPHFIEIDSTVPLLVLTAHGSIDLAIEAIKLGAEQFLIKPIELNALLTVLRRQLENRRIKRAHNAGTLSEKRSRIDPFLGESRAVRAFEDQARRLLQTESPILIQGETGTGKSVLAAWLHRHGPRGDEPFVDLNCGGLSRDSLENELFGHETGAFAGAVTSKPGLLEVAHRGTVFLDEIGDVDPQVQPKLLKVLDEKRFRRLGDVVDREVDVNLIAATNHNLGADVCAGRFRSDLYYRINAIPLVIPPLREREDDVLIIARSLLASLAAAMGRSEAQFTADAERTLKNHEWRGNIRELRNVIERAVLLGGNGRTIGRHDLRFDVMEGPVRGSDPIDMTLQELERTHIQRVLEAENGKVEAGARRLGIPRSSLYQKLKAHAIKVKRS